ncbi:hypothetical protein F2Q69_00015882 [Brassica cretica]|uniref:Uncharacterized protein n=1 Tax=Brassica cretica TaxID=69181 RepID=A0A8S9QZM5_BRACR|nr:hypothetical protein F2Q69_00015882 [Brassica cretica]
MDTISLSRLGNHTFDFSFCVTSAVTWLTVRLHSFLSSSFRPSDHGSQEINKAQNLIREGVVVNNNNGKFSVPRINY